ncbi:N-6 DNA methylase [Dokdonella sp.]|uniref:Eco57I restriction-modification methylase domain-containing protein n=1 Tax=Dokdonella sp. TaxID=2291710 RepID=UPI0025C3F12B|nr:N-6 DNA methylase [Dokdonella sp.]
MPEDRRGVLGAYYTPPALTQRLVDQVAEAGADWRTARILDPAAGGGAFMVEIAMRMRAAMIDCRPEFVLAQIGTRLLGLEIDPCAACLAQSALEIVLGDLAAAAKRKVPAMVLVRNTLEESPVPEYDVVLGNPPYGRVALSPLQRDRYQRSLYGHANLYGVFTDVALRWARPGGLIAYLTPTSFLAGQYYSALRALLAKEAPPVAVDFVHARKGIFEDVLQETMIAVYRRAAEQGRVQIHYLTMESERQASVIRNGTVGIPTDAAAPWLAPRQPEHSALIHKTESMPARLADWGYSVSTGPLVWNRFKDQLSDWGTEKNAFPLIWAESVSSEGKFAFRAEKKNHHPYFKLEKGDEWLLVLEPCVLVQRTTSKEQARRLIAAELPAYFIDEHGGVVVENHLNMIRSSQKPKVSPAVLATLLNSRALDEVFRCMNGSVAVSAFELEALPLPQPAELKKLRQLVREGASREKLEAECDRLYGLKR